MKEVWEKALFHCDKVVTVMADYDLSPRVRVPFILLYLNRHGEAYSELLSWHRPSICGGRSYPVEPNCRYRDISSNEFTPWQDQDQTLPYLLGLAIHQDACHCSSRCYFAIQSISRFSRRVGSASKKYDPLWKGCSRIAIFC